MSALACSSLSPPAEVSEDDARRATLRCAERFDLLASICHSAANGTDPLDGARFIVDALDDLADDLALLGRAVRNSPGTAS